METLKEYYDKLAQLDEEMDQALEQGDTTKANEIGEEGKRLIKEIGEKFTHEERTKYRKERYNL